ncbi:hypothetical protein F5Y17DRAFT_19946 [Xylariaceae sp. FL0594]|nr:hypothetical protein F5Y17DRAFT_19946 [Xylariaceae sp. FL0594]
MLCVSKDSRDIPFMYCIPYLLSCLNLIKFILYPIGRRANPTSIHLLTWFLIPPTYLKLIVTSILDPHHARRWSTGMYISLVIILHTQQNWLLGLQKNTSFMSLNRINSVPPILHVNCEGCRKVRMPEATRLAESKRHT